MDNRPVHEQPTAVQAIGVQNNPAANHHHDADLVMMDADSLTEPPRHRPHQQRIDSSSEDEDMAHTTVKQGRSRIDMVRCVHTVYVKIPWLH